MLMKFQHTSCLKFTHEKVNIKISQENPGNVYLYYLYNAYLIIGNLIYLRII